jgi:hypothetical protein
LSFGILVQSELYIYKAVLVVSGPTPAVVSCDFLTEREPYGTDRCGNKMSVQTIQKMKDGWLVARLACGCNGLFVCRGRPVPKNKLAPCDRILRYSWLTSNDD